MRHRAAAWITRLFRRGAQIPLGAAGLPRYIEKISGARPIGSAPQLF
jgi:hypothetical protein